MDIGFATLFLKRWYESNHCFIDCLLDYLHPNCWDARGMGLLFLKFLIIMTVGLMFDFLIRIFYFDLSRC